jgi:adenosylcobinamide-GDP ribazoletransferase
MLITRIPLPCCILPKNPGMPSADAIALMPLVGGLFGLAATLPARFAAIAVPPAASAWIACGLYTILGWSLHLDGWGDLWDGIGSGKRGDDLRRVMKDSRTGAFGVSGIALAIGTRAALLSSINIEEWIFVCAVAGGVGRFASASAARVGEYPWDEGMGRDIVRNFNGCQFFRSFIAACLMFPLAPFGWAAGMILSGVCGAALAMWANKNLGGTNGDIIGASAVMGEILVLICCSIF